MSSNIGSLDLSAATVGATGVMDWSGQGLPAQNGPPARIQLFNESGCGLDVTLNASGRTFHLPAGGWTQDGIVLAANDRSLSYRVTSIIPNAPIAQLTGVYYGAGERVPLVSLGNSPIGISGTVTSTVSNLAYDVTAYGAKCDGVTDDTAAIQAAINAAQSGTRGIVLLGAGISQISAPLQVTASGISIVGRGQWASTLRLTAGFVGAAAIIATSANGFEARDFGITGTSAAYSANPAADGIQVITSYVADLSDLYISFLNGWGVVVSNTNLASSFSPRLHNVFVTRGNQGIRLLGNPTNQSMGATLTNCAADNVQGGDGFSIENVEDAQLVNCGGYTVAAGARSLAILGSGDIYVSNLDVGATHAGVGPTVEINSLNAINSGTIAIVASLLQKGSVGVLVAGNASDIIIDGNHVSFNLTHGIQITSGDKVAITGNTFDQNGQTAGAGHYEIESSAATGRILIADNVFGTAQGTVSSGQVQAAINANNNNTHVFSNLFGAANGANAFNGVPTVARSNAGYNSRGWQAPPAVPASTGTIVNPFPFDVAVYIFGGTGVAVWVDGQNTNFASGVFPVPAGKSIRLDYTAAPGWKWFGL